MKINKWVLIPILVILTVAIVTSERIALAQGNHYN